MINIARCFLVGCPRSGTTLLQSMLAAHPSVYSLPETHFFARTKSQNKFLATLDMTDGEMRNDLDAKFMQLPQASTNPPNSIGKFAVGNYIRAFCNRLDRLSLDANKSVWLEKTPQHLLRIGTISRFANGARFVHIIRNGKDTISSLFAVTNKHPEHWGGTRTLNQCIERWTNDIRISHSYMFLENHLIVSYARLIAEPETQLLRICRFFDLEYAPSMTTQYQDSYRNIVKEPDAIWTEKAGQPLGIQGSHFDTALEKSEQVRVVWAETRSKAMLDELVMQAL